MKRALLACLAILPAAAVHAASFDCKKALNAAERKICASGQLSSLDSRLADTYAAALELTPDAKSLRDEQRAWLKERDRCFARVSPCENEDVADEYRDRIHEFEERILKADCSLGNEPAMARCEGLKAQVFDARMAALIEQMKAQLLDPDAELVAQKAWKEYRDEECQSRISEGGSLGGAENWHCLADFTSARIKDLQEYHFCTENDCPGRKPDQSLNPSKSP